ncbi:MAG: hypothetical protein ACYC9M_16270, partial [Desulfobulbaceae bacterium]
TCVDVVETDEGPRAFEVSAFGGFRGIQEACGIDAARHYADLCLREGLEYEREVHGTSTDGAAHPVGVPACGTACSRL